MMQNNTAFMPATTLPKPNKWRNNRGAVTKKKSLRASLAIRTFKPEPFRPFLPNPHLQTILSTFFPKPPTVHYTRVTLPSDDDQAVLQIDIANGTSLEPQSHEILPDESTKPVFVILHGLESSSTGVVTLRLVDALRPLDCKVVVLNYRSCAENEQFPKTLRLYHAGFTEDLTTLLRNIRQSAEKHNLKPPPIYLCGFSLGSNILCNFLGRLGQRAETEFNVVAAAGACVPFDVTACQAKIDSGWTGAVYSSYLVSTMRSKLRAAEAAGVDTSVLDVEKVMRADRIGSIDEEFISPVFGFKDRYDYYQQVGMQPFFILSPHLSLLNPLTH